MISKMAWVLRGYASTLAILAALALAFDYLPSFLYSTFQELHALHPIWVHASPTIFVLASYLVLTLPNNGPIHRFLVAPMKAVLSGQPNVTSFMSGMLFSSGTYLLVILGTGVVSGN